jgi:hypothetical protein
MAKMNLLAQTHGHLLSPALSSTSWKRGRRNGPVRGGVKIRIAGEIRGRLQT